MTNNSNISRVINLAFLAQFVNFLEFVLITPLSPYFTDDLGIQTSEVGWIIGSYALAAALSGIISSLFIDNHDRKKVLIVCFSGMVLGTLFCIASYDFKSLIFSRLIAGMFGGPATAITLAILSDFVPNAQRGKAFGKVMRAFPLAAIIGAPAAIELARLHSWQTAYLIVLLIEIICIIFIIKFLPRVNAHINVSQEPTKKLHKLVKILGNRNYLTGFSSAFFTFLSFFLVVPNLANLMIFNFNLPPQYLSVFFFIGGISAFFIIQIVGWICDKYNSTVAMLIMTISFALSIFGALIMGTPSYVSWFFMVLFMASVSPRNTVLNVATSKLPAAHDRAGYLSMQNAVQNIATSMGGFISGAILTADVSKELIGIEFVGTLAIVIAIIVPLLIHKIEKITSS